MQLKIDIIGSATVELPDMALETVSIEDIRRGLAIHRSELDTPFSINQSQIDKVTLCVDVKRAQ